MSTSDVRFAETAPGASLVAENGVLDPLATPAETVARHDAVVVGYVPLTGCRTLRSTATEIREHSRHGERRPKRSMNVTGVPCTVIDQASWARLAPPTLDPYALAEVPSRSRSLTRG